MDSFTDRLASVFLNGGPVMWPLLALSVISLTLSFERLIFWIRNHGPSRRRWLVRLDARLREGDDAAARAQISKDGSVYAKAAEAILDAPASSRPTPVELIELVRSDAERFSASQSTIITAAPLLGILGTVLGIIQSFNLLGGGQAVTDIGAVASGIGEALITTAFGLIVALITLFPYMAFRAHADRCISAIEAVGEREQARRS
jgi:biopolymer transport protein ExbB